MVATCHRNGVYNDTQLFVTRGAFAAALGLTLLYDMYTVHARWIVVFLAQNKYMGSHLAPSHQVADVRCCFCRNTSGPVCLACIILQGLTF